MEPYRIKSIREYHQILGIRSPEHPLISVINLEEIETFRSKDKVRVVFDFYNVSLKKTTNGHVKYHYGQQQYDFDEGILFFIAPGQVFSFEPDNDFESSGWGLLVHPDFLWGTALAKSIKQYGFFNYSVNEALFVSEKEENILLGFIQNIERECHANLDRFSESIVISQLESLLSYSDRFYHRQFLTRKITSKLIVNRLEEILEEYFTSDKLIEEGIPSVEHVSEMLNTSPNYLSGLLKAITGRSTQEHIHDKIIEKAKDKLTTTNLSVNEIAFELGYEYPQSFSKLFKRKTNVTPKEFRMSFN